MNPKYCSKCGARLEEGSSFCSECGYGVNKLDDLHKSENKKRKEFDPFKQKADATTTVYAEHTKKSGNLLGIIGLASIALAGVLFLAFMLTNFINKPDSLFKSFKRNTEESSQEGFVQDFEEASEEVVTAIHEVKGQFYSGRAIDIIGEGFGQYNMNQSSVTIDRKESVIISWADSSITVIVPSDVSQGDKEIVIKNPPTFKKETISAKFQGISKNELARGKAIPNEETIIEGKGIKVIIPTGSIQKEKELIIYRYETPTEDESEFYTVTDEFEITDKNGGHVFFNEPVLLGLDVVDEEEAAYTTIQYFDEAMGTWIKAETAYNTTDGKLYVKAKHFSPWRKLKDKLKKKISDSYDSAIDKGKAIINYPYKAGKAAVEKVLELGEEAYIIFKDNTVENFIGISGRNVIVFYRESDAKNDPSIPETAKKAAAAYEVAYEAYAELLGIDNMPYGPKLVRDEDDFFKDFFFKPKTGPTSQLIKTKIIEDPLKVYIDPNYNAKGANYSILTGSISMPSKYPDDDLAVTCAHELFHAVQHHQYGSKMLYMANGLKDTTRSMLESDKEVSKYLANNKWYFEATAEFAARFVGTNVGIDVLHSGTEASSPYYAFSGYANGQEYGMAAFIDYITTNKNTDIANRKLQFKNMWNYILKNYSTLSSVNVALNNYVTENMNTTAVSLYGDFWRDVVTQASMPTIPLKEDKIGSAGIVGIQDFVTLKRNRRMWIKSEGYGIFRVPVNENSVISDETAIQRSLWLELSAKNMTGSVYQLNGLGKEDRVDRGIEPIGYVNVKDSILKEALVPYKQPNSFALIALFRGTERKEIILKCLETSLVWDNQSELEKKVKNTTLDFKDKLKFTPVLPKQKNGDEPFRAVVVLNDDIDFTREVSRVENGKTFEVDPPMNKDSTLPPDEITANVQIFQGENLIHQYQSHEKEKEEIIELILEVADGELEAGNKALFAIKGIPNDVAVTRTLWESTTKPKGLVKEKVETKGSQFEIEFKEAMVLDISVSVYGTVDGKESLLGSVQESYSIEEKTKPVTTDLSAIAGEWIPIGDYHSSNNFNAYDREQMERMGRSLYFDGQGNMIYTHAVTRSYNSKTGEYGEVLEAFQYPGKYTCDKNNNYSATVDDPILYERFLHEVNFFNINITEHEGKMALKVNTQHINRVIYIKK